MQPEITSKAPAHYCPVCEQSDHLSLLCSVNDYTIFTCSVCHTDHVFPTPDKKILKTYYDRPEWFEGGESGGYQDYDAQTEWSIDLVEVELEAFGSQTGLSVLDVGCGYGTRLAVAAKRGWKCFGVELSDHARTVARERLGNTAYIVEDVSDLIPHEFDLVLILDTIEHLSSPYALLYQLFAIGAITPKTRLVVTTPNAGSDDAQSDPAGWAYRHPTSHLVYYSAESLQFLLSRLRFKDISVSGLHGATDKQNISSFAGLVVRATGSDFTEFMRERYVPGTWSKIAEYEHMPRYILARRLAKNKQVLDFGCGTGYGSAILAEEADSVTGLDIDASAIEWARKSHRNPRLKFHRCDDLGESLVSASVDLVTCFEMIEHVDYQTQQAVIASIGRLLREDGLLIISTPNPEVTKLYGENPYHLREMTEAEFVELLKVEFSHIQIVRQLVRNSIAFSTREYLTSVEVSSMLGEQEKGSEPLAFIAICSRQPIPEMSSLVLFDDNADLVGDFLSAEKKINQARFSAYSYQERVLQLDNVSIHLNSQIASLNEVIHRLNGVDQQKDAAIKSQSDEIHRLLNINNLLNQTKWMKLGRLLRLIKTN